MSMSSETISLKRQFRIPEEVKIGKFVDVMAINGTDEYAVLDFYQTALAQPGEGGTIRGATAEAILQTRLIVTWSYLNRIAATLNKSLEEYDSEHKEGAKSDRSTSPD